MDFRVIDRRSLDAAEWTRFCRGGSFFQTVTWADVCARGLPADRAGVGAEALFLCGNADGRLVAGMPAIITKRYGVTSFDSMPNHTYGSVIFADDLSAEAKAGFVDHVTAYLNEHRFSRITITDFAGQLTSGERLKLDCGRSFTHMIRIDSIHDLEPHQRIKRDLRIGSKADTEIVRIRDREDIDDFYRLYDLTESRHGRRRPLYRRGFFHALADVMGESDMLYWPGLMVEGRMIASQINFIYGDTMINWRVVSDYDWRRYKPNQVLLYDAIEKASAKGVTQINLGASPPEAEGLIAYKERWGGAKTEFDIYSYRSRMRRWMGR
jgi:CelD/BcsL family acetyltransferase involved in cellulose biosynthesis